MSDTSSPPLEPAYTALIIGTEGGLLEPVERAVQNHDCAVHRAHTGSEGFVSALKIYPDVILCDDRLTDMSSDLLISQIRQTSILGDVPIMGLGKRRAPLSELNRLTSGLAVADVYIAKPFSLQNIQQQLKLLLARTMRRHIPQNLWLQGDLAGFNLPDILTVTEQSMLTGMLVAQTPLGIFRFLFDTGKLMLVAGPHNITGVKALFRALRPEEGSFTFHPWREVYENPSHEHIRIGNALLGAMQEKDELPIAWRDLRKDLPEDEQHLTIGPNISKGELEEYETLTSLREGKAIGLTVQQLLDQSELIDLDALKEIHGLIKQNVLISFP